MTAISNIKRHPRRRRITEAAYRRTIWIIRTALTTKSRRQANSWIARNKFISNNRNKPRFKIIKCRSSRKIIIGASFSRFTIRISSKPSAKRRQCALAGTYLLLTCARLIGFRMEKSNPGKKISSMKMKKVKMALIISSSPIIFSSWRKRSGRLLMKPMSRIRMSKLKTMLENMSKKSSTRWRTSA